MSDSSEVGEFRRGWKTVMACTFGIALGLTGMTYYCFSVFVVPVAEAFGWTRGEATRASSCLIIGTAITAPIIGTIIDRYGARRVCLISMTCIALGYLVLSQLTGSLPLFYATWLGVALVGGGTTTVVYARAVSMWFDKGRGLALGLALAGSGIAGILGPSFCTFLIRNYGWQGGYIGMAAVTFGIGVPVLAVFFREREIRRDGGVPLLPGFSVQEALRRKDFWKIALGFILVASVVAGMQLSLVPMLRDRGMTPEEAARTAGVMGFAVTLGRIAVGYLVDRFGGRVVAWIFLSLAALGCFVLTIPGTPSWVSTVSAASFGFAAATEVNLVAYLSSRYFGMRAYGKIYGWQVTVFYLGSATGPLAVGFAYDRFHGYAEVQYACVVMLLIGATIIGSLGKPPVFAEIREN